MKIKFIALLAPALLLSACDEEVAEADTTATGGEAEGEILGGTISDNMIALEQLTSTSPPAEPVSDGASGASASDPGEEAEQSEPEPAEAEAPESAPAPETETENDAE